MNYEPALSQSFQALAHPVRRQIVERLTAGPATVGEATRGLPVSKPAITKHVRLLEEAAIVRREIEGRTHLLSLVDPPLAGPATWIACQRALWERKFDVLEDYLREQASR